MAEGLRAKPADFQVVFEDRQRLAQVARLGLKELPLETEARPPSQDRADVEALAFDLTKHLFRGNPFRRHGIVRAAGGVNVVIAAVEAERSRVDPALQLDVK